MQRTSIFLLFTFLLFVLCAPGEVHAQTSKAAPSSPPSAPEPQKAAPSSQLQAPQKTVPSSKLQAAREEGQQQQLTGSLTGDNLYSNPALSMTLQLSGNWQIMDDKMKRVAGMMDDENDAAGQGEAKTHSLCMGPLCETPENIQVGLITQTDQAPSVIFILGFKLAPEYLDREQHPLKSFADMMLRNSGKTPSQLTADGPTALQLGGRPAYRLLVRAAGAETSQEAGYIVESNGYLLLMVAVASPASDLPKLQAEIEGVQFK